MPSSSDEARTDLERAETAINERNARHPSPLTFGTPRGVLRWYSRTRGPAGAARAVSLHTTRRVVGFDRRGHVKTEAVRVNVSGSQGLTVDDVRAALIDVSTAIERLKVRQPGRVRALELTVTHGEPQTAHKRPGPNGEGGRILLKQEEAARRLNVTQACISQWVGWCERELRPAFVDAGLIVEVSDD